MGLRVVPDEQPELGVVLGDALAVHDRGVDVVEHGKITNGFDAEHVAGHFAAIRALPRMHLGIHVRQHGLSVNCITEDRERERSRPQTEILLAVVEERPCNERELVIRVRI